MAEDNSETHQLFEEVQEDEEQPKTSQIFTDSESRRAKAIGYGCAFGSMFFHALSVAFAQALGGYLPDFELNLWRFTAQFVCVAPVVIYNKWNLRPKRKHIPWVALVCLAYNVSNYTYYTASVHLPVGTVSGLTQSLAIILVAMATLVMTRKCRLHVAVSVILCMTGVILLTQPDFIFRDILGARKAAGVFLYKPICSRAVEITNVTTVGHSNQTIRIHLHSNTTESERSTSGGIEDYLLLLAASVSMAVFYIVPHVWMKNANPFITLFWMASVGMVLSAVAMAIFGQLDFPRSAVCIVFLVGHSSSAALCSLCTQISVQSISPVIFSLAQSIQVILLFAAQYTILRHLSPGHRNVVEIVGVVVVFAGNIAGPLYELYRDVLRKASKDPPEIDYREIKDE